MSLITFIETMLQRALPRLLGKTFVAFDDFQCAYGHVSTVENKMNLLSNVSYPGTIPPQLLYLSLMRTTFPVMRIIMAVM